MCLYIHILYESCCTSTQRKRWKENRQTERGVERDEQIEKEMEINKKT